MDSDTYLAAFRIRFPVLSFRVRPTDSDTYLPTLEYGFRYGASGRKIRAGEGKVERGEAIELASWLACEYKDYTVEKK
jgi:hypothetical protein